MSMIRHRALCAWLMGSFFYAYQYILRVMPNIMMHDIMKTFHIDAAVFGQFSGAYYLGYCLIHVPLGVMLDRWGPRKVMSLCMAFAALGLLPILWAEHWIYPVMGRFLIGAGSSAAILGTFKIIRMVFEEKHFTKMLSFAVTIGLLGAIYGGAPISYACTTYGYQAVLQTLIGLGCIMALATYILTPDIQTQTSSGILEDLKKVMTHRKVLKVCFFAGLMVGPLEGFADAWGSEFLKQVYGFERDRSHSLLSLIYIGMCFAPALSRVAEKTGRYLETIVGAGGIMFLAFLTLIGGLFTLPTMMIGFFAVGVCCAYQILAIYKASTYVPEQVSGLTTAVANMIIMSFGYVFHTVMGCVIRAFSPYGTKLSYIYGVGAVPLFLLVGVIGFWSLARQEQRP